MSDITKYHVEALINGSVAITPNPLKMRLNDEKTPQLDVWVSYMTADDKKRPFILTDKIIKFEVITPGGAAGVISSESSSCFEVVNHEQGHFLFALPPECRDAVGSSKMAYFRFTESNDIFSTGDFAYTVVKDIYSAPRSDLKMPINFNKELEKLQAEFKHVEALAKDAIYKVGLALAKAIETEKALGTKQDRVEDAVNDNIASWEDGGTKDSGIKTADVIKTINARHYHKNKGVLNKFIQVDDRIYFESHKIAYEDDLRNSSTGTSFHLLGVPIEHNLGCYPAVLVIEFSSGYGANGYGTNGYGTNGYCANRYGAEGYGANGYGADGYGRMVRGSFEYLNNRTLRVYLEKQYPEVKAFEKINPREYRVAFPDISVTLLIQLFVSNEPAKAETKYLSEGYGN